MRITTAIVVAAGLAAAAAAGAASAASGTDTDYLRASRCKGLASGALGQVDTAALDAYLKAEGRRRTTNVLDRGQEALDKAKREAARSNEARKAQLTAELNGPCQVYKG
jgi:hypothetical protein